MMPARGSSVSVGPSTTAPAPSPNSTVTSRPRVEKSSEWLWSSDADQQDALVDAGLHERVGHLQAVDEGRALLADVEARAAVLVRDAELLLQEDRRAREVDVRRERAEDDAVDVLRLEAGVRDARASRPGGRVAAVAVLPSFGT